MIIALVCLGMGLAFAVGQNIPEIRETLRYGHGHPYIGTAGYLVTASLSYALALWIIALAILALTGRTF